MLLPFPLLPASGSVSFYFLVRQCQLPSLCPPRFVGGTGVRPQGTVSQPASGGKAPSWPAGESGSAGWTRSLAGAGSLLFLPAGKVPDAAGREATF